MVAIRRKFEEPSMKDEIEFNDQFMNELFKFFPKATSTRVIRAKIRKCDYPHLRIYFITESFEKGELLQANTVTIVQICYFHILLLKWELVRAILPLKTLPNCMMKVLLL